MGKNAFFGKDVYRNVWTRTCISWIVQKCDSCFTKASNCVFPCKQLGSLYGLGKLPKVPFLDIPNAFQMWISQIPPSPPSLQIFYRFSKQMDRTSTWSACFSHRLPLLASLQSLIWFCYQILEAWWKLWQMHVIFVGRDKSSPRP